MSIEWFESLGPWTGTGEFDLTRMRTICEQLGAIQERVPYFHIAGTNGKGSTSACVAALVGSTGVRAGLNTSPHLINYRERFLIDGYPIGENKLKKAVKKIESACKNLGLTPSFHEGATLVAFAAFADLEIAIYEVGLGGRLDASNVLKKPLASIITSIGLDHQGILGDSIEKIAFEKAGIFKNGTPAVLGSVCDVARAECRKIAGERGVALYEFGEDFEVLATGDVYRYKSNSNEFEFESSLAGKVQNSNMACALKAAELSGIDIRTHSKALKHVYWPARYETIEYRDKEFLVDCAHNQQGIEALVSEISNRALKEGLVIFGMLKRPDWKEIIAKLARLSLSFALVTAPGERGIHSRVLREEFEAQGIKNVCEFDSDYEAILEYAASSGFSTIVITGSIYLVGAIRPLLNVSERPVWIREKS